MSNEFVGDRLRLARLLNGYTQQEVGAAVFVSRQHIHQLESGARMPADDVLGALAEFLGVEPSFFFNPLESDVKAEQCHFRKRRTTPVGMANRVLAFGTIFEQLVTQLHQTLDLPEPDFDVVEKYGYESASLSAPLIERIAEASRKHWGLGNDSPIDNMTRVLENAGAIVTHFEGVSDKVDALSMNRKYPVILRNTAKSSTFRLRFDLAHECGHLILHQGIETGDKLTEKQADAFASAFLMPREAFADEFLQCLSATRIRWSHVWRMKLRWRVSARAIIYRAHFLGLINAQQYRGANVYLNNKGYSKSELYDDTLPLEEPEIIPSALEILSTELGITTDKIARKLHISHKVLGELVGTQLLDTERQPTQVVPLFY